MRFWRIALNITIDMMPLIHGLMKLLNNRWDLPCRTAVPSTGTTYRPT